MTITVTDAPARSRFEARMPGESAVAGFARYMRTPELIAFIHTEVGPGYEGRGVGSALARKALESARARGLQVLAVCPFIAGWMDHHPEYTDLVYHNRSRVFD
jgi:hypothetical protein